MSDTLALVEHLRIRAVDRTTMGRLHLSGHVVCANRNGSPVALVGGERSPDTRVRGLIEALHWYLARYRPEPGKRLPTLRYVVGAGTRADEVRHGLAVIVQALGNRVPVEISTWPGGPVDLDPPQWSADAPRVAGWCADLCAHDQRTPRRELRAIAASAGHPVFRWWLTDQPDVWSGRVDGLEVCRATSEALVLKPAAFGAWPEDVAARRGFREAVGRGSLRLGNGQADRDRAAEILRVLAAARARPGSALYPAAPREREAARVLRGAAHLADPELGPLRPVLTEPLYEIPVLTSPGGTPTTLDLLLRTGRVPWVVAVEVPEGGLLPLGRHGILRALLQAAFVRGAAPVAPWLAKHGLDAASCRPMVAISPVESPADRDRMASLVALGALLGVTVAPLTP